MRIYQNVQEMLSEAKRDLFEMWERLKVNSMQNKVWDFYITELQWYQFSLTLDWDKKEIVWDLFKTDEFILAELKKYLTFIHNWGNIIEENENFLDYYLKELEVILEKYKENIKNKWLFEILWIMSEEEYDEILNFVKSNKEDIINYMSWLVKEYKNLLDWDINNIEIKFDDKFKALFSTFFRLWILLDFSERIDERRINPWEAYKVRLWVWWNFIEWSKFSYTYWERIMKLIKTENWYEHQLNLVINELIKKISTRQAVLQIFDWNIDLPNMWWKHRIPCSLHYQFMIRSSWKKIPRNWKDYKIDNFKWLPKMIIFYNMRSVDFLTHFPIDIAQAINLWSYVKNKVEKWIWIKIEDWELVFNAQSFHAYSYDLIWNVF